MDALQRMRLQIVDASLVRSHEFADPGREHRIFKRLRDDRVLRDPLIVGTVPDVQGYVLLDGTNRTRALAELGLPYVLVQLIDYADEHNVQLQTWCHAADLSLPDILGGIMQIPGVTTLELPPLATGDALRSLSTLAVLANRDEQFAVSRIPEHPESRAEQLRSVVDLYEFCMVRMDCAPDEVEQRARSLPVTRSLIAFPPFARSQVVTMAIRGTLIPAGITRHVIAGGRALRVNVPLEMLDGTSDLDTANALLQRHLDALQPRLYREPTVLFDS